MPLEFESLSHGKIAFGFFNIDTDMILLNQYFLFAEDFCHYIVQASKEKNFIFKTLLGVYLIQKETDMGNLMGAIHGFDYQGFIGAVYKLFPFPKYQEDFKQKPEGYKNRVLIEGLIRKFAKEIDIPFVINLKDNQMGIGDFLFDGASFQKLIQYIWQGGYPRWKDQIRPDYVLAMKEKIEQSPNPLFQGLSLE